MIEIEPQMTEEERQAYQDRIVTNVTNYILYKKYTESEVNAFLDGLNYALAIMRDTQEDQNGETNT